MKSEWKYIKEYGEIKKYILYFFSKKYKQKG